MNGTAVTTQNQPKQQPNQRPPNPLAYPRPFSENKTGSRYYSVEDGMTLRDYFAGQVAVGLCFVEQETAESFAKHDMPLRLDSEGIARQAYGIADAMLKARQP